MKPKLSKQAIALAAKKWGKKFESLKRVEPKNQIVIQEVNGRTEINVTGYSHIETLGLLRYFEANQRIAMLEAAREEAKEVKADFKTIKFTYDTSDLKKPAYKLKKKGK